MTMPLSEVLLATDCIVKVFSFILIFKALVFSLESILTSGVPDLVRMSEQRMLSPFISQNLNISLNLSLNFSFRVKSVKFFYHFIGQCEADQINL